MLIAIAAALVVAMSTRNVLRVDVIRDRGALGREVAGGLIENVYRLQVMNASEQPLTLLLHADGVPEISIQTTDGRTTLQLDAASHTLVPVVVRAPAEDLPPGLHDVMITLAAPDGSTARAETTRFYVPQ